MSVKRIIRLARKKLKHFNKCKQRHLHVSIITYNGKPIAIGISRLGANRYSKRRGYKRSIHSECDALRRIRGRPFRRRKGLKIYNVRFSKTGEIGFAKPCELCMKLLEDNGIRVAYYT